MAKQTKAEKAIDWVFRNVVPWMLVAAVVAWIVVGVVSFV